MSKATTITESQFAIGERVHHRLFDYRGVIVDVDADFQGTEEWYLTVAKSRPPKNKPWYHVLVHNSSQATYVAERNLEPDESDDAISHPLLMHFFTRFTNGRYVRDNQEN